MRISMLLAVVTASLCLEGAVAGDEKLALPASPAPVPVIASMAESWLVVRMKIPGYASRPVKNEKDGKEKRQAANESAWRDETYLFEEGQVRVYDTNGKEVNWKTLKTLLKKETPGLYSGYEKIDPLHLRNIKEGTLIFMYKEPEEPQDAPKPAFAGLPELLKKHGYLAVPLERLGSGHLVVRVQINGKMVLLAVDTGASNTCLDRWRVRHLGLKWEDDVECVLKAMEIGKLKTGEVRVVAHDMTEGNETNKANNYPLFDGLLGSDVLQKFSAVIDHGGAVLYLRKREEKK